MRKALICLEQILQILERPEAVLACAALAIVIMMLMAIMLRISRRDAERDMSMIELRQAMDERIDDIRTQTESGLKRGGEAMRLSVERLNDDMARALAQSESSQRARMDEYASRVSRSASAEGERSRAFSEDIGRRMDELNRAVERSRQESARRMDDMRAGLAVDAAREANARLDAALAPLCDRIEQLSGELNRLSGIAQALEQLNAPSSAAGAGAPLDALLMQWLAPGRYVRRFEIGTGSGRFADFAIILPEENGQPLYLPVDSSFPAAGHAGAWDEAARRSLSEAATAYSLRVSSELIKPGLTCDMAIMLIQSELVSARISDLEASGELNMRDRRVLIMGPGAFGAMARMLEGGINALIMQQRSAEIERLLSDVRQELGRFSHLISADTDARAADAPLHVDSRNGGAKSDIGTYARGDAHMHTAGGARIDNEHGAHTGAPAAQGVNAAQSGFAGRADGIKRGNARSESGFADAAAHAGANEGGKVRRAAGVERDVDIWG